MNPARSLFIGALLCSPFVLRGQYFQQRVDYTIKVQLDDTAHVLHASESFTYTNNSPRALDTLWMHLWPNAYKDRGTALCRQMDEMNDFSLHFATPADRGYIDSLDFRSGDTPLEWRVSCCGPDIAWIKLPLPLQTGSSITITTPFRVKLPDGRFSRLGHTKQAYYITQWYPKPAVYDARGWHPMPYLNQGEFYSEFGSFDVSITLPANYVVGATGVRVDQPSEEVWMDSLATAPLPGTTDNSFPASSGRTKTLRFKQDDVHDFAWFADKRFIVRKGEVTLQRSGRSVTTWVLFTPKNAEAWKDGITYVNESVRLYSEWVGDYPYSACTAVDGTIAAGGGMEYPMITIIGGEVDAMALDEVIAHEVGHNWFYGILGSNERDHAWMDEGVNSFVELRYMRERYPGHKSVIADDIPGFLLGRTIGHRDMDELGYRFNARRNLDQPIEQTSTAFTSVNYGTTVYMKTALVFDHLFAYLGAETFDRCMQAYYDRWHHKHPYPEDMRKVFEQESGENLAWCFEEFIGTDRKIDAKAVGLKDGVVTTRAKGSDAPVPFPVTAWSGTDSLGTVWVNDGNAYGLDRDTLPWGNADRVRIDAGSRTLDIDRRNNSMGSQGLLKGWIKPQLKFLSGIEQDDRRTAYWTPLVGYNTHDGWMLGLHLRNTTMPSQRFEWALAPLYGTQSGRFLPNGRATYHFDRLETGPFRNIHLGLSNWSASLGQEDDVDIWYNKTTPSIRFDIRREGVPTTEHSFGYRTVIATERAEGSLEGDHVDLTEKNIYHEVRYDMERRAGLYPFQVNLTMLQHPAFTRASLDAKWSAIYDRHQHRISFRFFGGQFFHTDDELMEARMGWRYYLGSSDLLYDNLFIDRQQTGDITAQQFDKVQGGFKTPNSLGTSDSWIAALNVELDAPFPLPLSLFFSAGAAPVVEVTQNERHETTAFQYEGGLGFRVWRDVVEVWVPLAFSEDIADQLNGSDFDFMERIRIVFAIERMDPTRMLRNLPH